MKLIVGLGNPGPTYNANRHNIGFRFIEAIANANCSPSEKKAFSGFFSKISLSGSSVGLLKPLTFMNLSGKSVQQAMAFYKISLENVYVIHDDVEVPFGKLKLKRGGGHCGHNGLKSIDTLLGKNYWRLRVGVGRPTTQQPLADFVLQNFSSEEENAMNTLCLQAAQHIDLLFNNV